MGMAAVAIIMFVVTGFMIVFMRHAYFFCPLMDFFKHFLIDNSLIFL